VKRDDVVEQVFIDPETAGNTAREKAIDAEGRRRLSGARSSRNATPFSTVRSLSNESTLESGTETAAHGAAGRMARS
jgi:hypothetical protein